MRINNFLARALVGLKTIGTADSKYGEVGMCYVDNIK